MPREVFEHMILVFERSKIIIWFIVMCVGLYNERQEKYNLGVNTR
jgi:hypothetical protein